MKSLAITAFCLTWNLVAHADGDPTHYNKVSSQPLKIESRTTEPTPLPEIDASESPDPIDQPPVLEYAQPPVAPPTQRKPANVTPTKFLDTEHGVACYYIIPPNMPGVVTPAPTISCVKLPEPKAPGAPATAPARTN